MSTNFNLNTLKGRLAEQLIQEEIDLIEKDNNYRRYLQQMEIRLLISNIHSLNIDKRIKNS